MDLDELEKLAKAATPGPWHFVGERPRDYPGFGSNEFPEVGITTHVGDSKATSKFIAAANPEAILKMIENQRMLMEENEALYERVKLMGEVVRAAEESEKKFMDIDDGFFTGLVPPEFSPVSKALGALNQPERGE